ncbi:MAG: HIRAN domain-containing protein [Actinobacteria bacterium]|nr:HIRAN domain-containing protein [Actinomycetota bacterium]
MGLFQRRKEKERPDGVDVLVLQDALLVDRIDAFHSGEYPRDKHPDTCQRCGNIDPGFRYCRCCGEEIMRKPKYGSFWFQEVVGEEDRQEAFAHLLMGADRDEDGGVREWVTVVLLPEQSNTCDENAVMVLATREGPAQHVGYIPRDAAPAVQRACLQAQATHHKVLACEGLVQGGFQLEDGQPASYSIRLLLPLPPNMLNQMNAAAWH